MSRTERTITTPSDAPLRSASLCVFSMGINLKAHSVIAVVLSCFVCAAFAVGPPVPQEFVGDWVPQTLSCQSRLRLRVAPASVSLMNGIDTQEFDDLDICHSCEGGSKYGGAVVWLIPEFGKGASPFIVRFNANEVKGIAVVEMKNSQLKKRFPLHNRKMRKCPG